MARIVVTSRSLTATSRSLPTSARWERLDLPPGQPGAVWRYHPRNPVVPRHHHDELECNLVTAGWGRYLVGDRRHDLRPGTLVWLFPGQVHHLIDVDPALRMWIGVWTPALVGDFVAAGALPSGWDQVDPPGVLARQLPRADTDGLARLFGRVEGAAGRGPVAACGLGWLLARLAEGWSDAPPAEPESAHPAVTAALRLLSAPEPPGPAELARRCGTRPDQLARWFRRDTGTTITAWRTRIRLEAACQALLAGEDATAAAFTAGFASYAGFHRAFTARFGTPPGRWQADQRSDD